MKASVATQNNQIQKWMTTTRNDCLMLSDCPSGGVELFVLNFPMHASPRFQTTVCARQHLGNGWRRWVQIENVYLNLKAEIPMSDDACHILKFQHYPHISAFGHYYVMHCLNLCADCLISSHLPPWSWDVSSFCFMSLNQYHRVTI